MAKKTTKSDNETSEGSGKAKDIPFRTSIKFDDFAKSMGRLPELGNMLRKAGARDLRTMSGVKVTSSRMQGLRAKAVGDERGIEKAKREEARAIRLAEATAREDARSTPEESVLGPLASMAGKFQLYGKVLDKSGAPVPYAQVEVCGKDSGALFSAKTDENGIYKLAVPVGGQKDELNDGEQLDEIVSLGDAVLQRGMAALVQEGSFARKILTVPLIETLRDFAAPIAPKHDAEPAQEKPLKDEVKTKAKGKPKT